MNIVCHAGPWSDKYLDAIAKEIYPKCNNTILSSHKGVDTSGLIDIYYNNLESNKNIALIEEEEDTDIIARCRLLRSISRHDALLHLNSMRSAIISVFDRFKPDIVISETIDSYIMDIICFECKKREIPFIGLVTVFINGYFRISARGEYNLVRIADTKEVDKVFKTLTENNYLPNFVKKDKVNPIYTITRKWSRNIVKIPYFFIKRRISGDYYNCHYWQSLIIAKDWFHFYPRFEVGDINWKKSLGKTNKTKIYVPLQMIPEATVDYWCDDVNTIDYENILINFIKSKEDIHFLVKEHPNVLGYRNPRLYKKLNSLNNVTMCPSRVNSNELSDFYDAVLVWTGTVGFEAALRGKPVLSFSHTYYFPDERSFLRISSHTSSNEIIKYIKKYSGMTDDRKKELIQHVLNGVAVGTVVFDGSWNPDCEIDINKMKKVASSLKSYIEQRASLNV